MIESSARFAAAQRIARQIRRFPDLEIAQPDESSLSQRDAALAHAITDVVLRRWLTLRTAIEPHLQKPWPALDPSVTALLLTTAAQLLFMDRIPAHAAVHEAVELAPAMGAARAGGLINAISRRVSELRGSPGSWDPSRTDSIPAAEGGGLALNRGILSEDPLIRLSQATSIGIATIRRWHRDRGWEEALRRARHSLTHAPTIIFGAPSDSPCCSPHREQGAMVFRGDRTSLKALLSSAPPARVQDPTSARAVPITRALSPGLIVDACAGRGTKTRQLAELHPHARIIATDIDARRRSALTEVAQSYPQVEVVPPGSLQRETGAVDLLLLDVPCSNSGVLARRLEARYRLNERSMKDLVDLQRQIIADHVSLVRPGGHLCYATCSIEPEENQRQVEWIMKWHPFSLTASHSSEVEGGPDETDECYQDGGFVALLERSAAKH